MASTTNLDTLKINYLTESQFENALANNQVNENELYMTPGGATILYNNDSNPVSTTSITISESAANFAMLKICYKTNDNDYASVDVYNPNGKRVILWGVYPGSTAAYCKASRWSINNTSMTYQDGCQMAFANASAVGYTAGSYCAITQVIGYKTI